MKNILRWSPRILGLLIAGLLTLLAFDVFAENQGFWTTVLALVAHLVPTGLVLLVLAFSWRWPLVGTVMFFGLAVLYPLLTLGRLNWTATLFISGPLLLASALFLGDWLATRRRHHRHRLATGR
ncbi:MAG: hypothetical protein JSU73_04960 [candidate division WOR-3 bacterium]|nr:MAG: hypothetical protein JSU73_04960 [candidate division WOR-3 bacterium]